MRRVSAMSAITVLLVAAASICYAGTTVKGSKSNGDNRLGYSSPIVTPTQATAALAEIDKMGRGADEGALRGILKRLGVKTGCGKGCINYIKVLKGKTFLVLENAADEPQAIAVFFEGKPGKPGTK